MTLTLEPRPRLAVGRDEVQLGTGPAPEDVDLAQPNLLQAGHVGADQAWLAPAEQRVEAVLLVAGEEVRVAEDVVTEVGAVQVALADGAGVDP